MRFPGEINSSPLQPPHPPPLRDSSYSRLPQWPTYSREGEPSGVSEASGCVTLPASEAVIRKNPVLLVSGILGRKSIHTNTSDFGAVALSSKPPGQLWFAWEELAKESLDWL